MDCLSQLKALFALIDKDVAAFQLKTGLRCPAGCGSCCRGRNVYTTELEMLPAAHEIFRLSLTSCFEALLQDRTDSGLCSLFNTDPPIDAAGHCRFYQQRPAVCRLFGYSGVRTRLGNMTLATCKIMKQHNQKGVTAAIERQLEAPCLSEYGTRIYAIDAALGTRLMPINEALRRSMERLGLHLRLSGATAHNV